MDIESRANNDVSFFVKRLENHIQRYAHSLYDRREFQECSLMNMYVVDFLSNQGGREVFQKEHKDGRIALRVFNPDGSEAEKTGNGVRVFSKYLFDSGLVKAESITLSTPGGDVEVRILNKDASLSRVLMGRATFVSDQIPVSGPVRDVVNEEMTFAGKKYAVTCVSIGNPHCVIPMNEISPEKARTLGKVVETSPQFPNRINLQLVKVLDRGTIAIEIFERGAGYTLASGSSSCAAAAAVHRLGMVDDRVAVHMPGGRLVIEVTGPDYAVHMSGTVARVGTFTAAREFYDLLQEKEVRNTDSSRAYVS